MDIKNDEVAMFKSNNGVILAADAAYAAAEEAVKGASDDHWYRQNLIKAALETALASVIVYRDPKRRRCFCFVLFLCCFTTGRKQISNALN